MNNENKDSFKRGEVLLRLVLLFVLLWVFLIAINSLSASINHYGKGMKDLLQTVHNPIIGLMMGVIVTCLLQSSSTTTSIIVGMVASGQLSVTMAVPMVMGANIGTTVTNTLVSLGSLTRSDEFRRSFAAANIHDVFNLTAVAILLPLEVIFGFVSKPALALTEVIFGSEASKPNSPIKAHFKAMVKSISHGLESIFGDQWAYIALFVLSIIVIVITLALIVKNMRGVILSRAELFFDKIIGKSAIIGILFGIIVTALVQSSSVTTSLMVPLAGTGVVTLATVFPITLGCNIGTTITALLAATATQSKEALAIAMCHLLFNIFGIVLIYPVPMLRNGIIRFVELLSKKCSERKSLALVYVVTVFIVVPAIILTLQKLFGG